MLQRAPNRVRPLPGIGILAPHGETRCRNSCPTPPFLQKRNRLERLQAAPKVPKVKADSRPEELIAMERDFLEQTRVKEGKLLHAQRVVSDMESILNTFTQQDLLKACLLPCPVPLPSVHSRRHCNPVWFPETSVVVSDPSSSVVCHTFVFGASLRSLLSGQLSCLELYPLTPPPRSPSAPARV
jgi:hypothetical protein